METVLRCITGDFRPQEVPRYLAFIAFTFWSLIFACWVVYPDDHHFSIMTHTFSFLGSFDAKHNPAGWWLFSIAMIFWGIAAVPVVFFIVRRLSAISTWAALPAGLLMLIGCAGIALVGIFPDAHGGVIGDLEWTDIHGKVAVAGAGGLVLGIAWGGLVLLADALLHRQRPPRVAHRRLIPPYVLLEGMCAVAAWFLVKWEYVYAEMKAAAAASGQHIGSAWSEAHNTRYSFPLWENLVIYTLFVFLIWFAYALSRGMPESRRT